MIQKEMEAIEEVIGCAVAHVERSFPEREIQVEIPEEFRLVPMDAKLIEQVITNLLDNAVKHTRPQEAITAVSYTHLDVYKRQSVYTLPVLAAVLPSNR